MHATSYYLNPQLLHYIVDFEVKHGLYDCLERMIGDVQEISKIDTPNLKILRGKQKFFGSQIEMASLKTKTLAQW